MPSSVLASRIFLLSPARLDGIRAGFLMRPEAKFELAVRLRENGASLGSIFSFMSGLYFRGKLTYANAFANPPEGIMPSFIITASAGLLPSETHVTLRQLEKLAKVPIDHKDPRYSAPLLRDAKFLASVLPRECSVVLLGSIATAKYVEPLCAAFGDRLYFPKDFIGRGDLSRGGLLLRSARTKTELHYIPVISAMRRGSRPPRMSPA